MAQAKCGFDSIPGGASGRELLAAYGPTLSVDIGFDAGYRPTEQERIPIPGLTEIQALVDTGATESCIDNLLAAQLNLPIVDRRPISGIHGSHLANMYLAQVYVPALGVTAYGAFAGVELAAGGQPHGVLIGRAFLQHFTMTYEGQTGVVTLTSE